MDLPINTVAIFFVALGTAAGDGYPRATLLVEAAELKTPEVAARFRVLDARGPNRYNAGHIPGAVLVNHAVWSKEFGNGRDQPKWQALIGKLGVETTSRLVVYDDDIKDAARVWWILRYWGFRDVRLLNGGWTAWKAANGEISRDVPALTATEPTLKARDNRLATKGQILEMLKTNQGLIVDARGKDEHCGIAETAKRNGAIPGSKHLDWVDLLDPKTRRFKGPTELTRLFKDADIDLSRPIVAHCQSGGRASVMVFALELMGAKNARNYYKSWAEWGNAEDTPIEKAMPRK